MEGNFFLEVDVNGEEVFMVDKRVISSYSGRISNLLGKSRGEATGNLKVIFHGFPGGPEGFELVTRFCYDKGRAGVNASNIFRLVAAADFLEMSDLLEQIERSSEEIKYWRWSEVMAALRQLGSQRVEGVSRDVLDKLLSSLVGRIFLCSETSPSPSASSSDNSSCDTGSSEGLRSGFARAMWWFDDLVALDVRVVEMAVRLMVLRNFDGGLIGRFLFHYLKSGSATASGNERVRIVEGVIEMIGILDVGSVSCKSLFKLLRVAVRLKVGRRWRNEVEGAIGELLDRATLDDLLVPAPPSRGYLYNVNLVINFVKSFLGKGAGPARSRLDRVAGLIDSYLGEIAPDPGLKPSKFLAVIRALPDSARDSFDGVYHAVNLYLEVHPGLSEEERGRLYRSINYEKLSPAASSHLAGNPRFPAEHAALALVSQRSKLKSLLQYPELSGAERVERCDQVVLYARRLNAVASGEHDEKVSPRLQRLQTRALEVEKVESVCMKMHPQIVKIRKSRILRLIYGGSLPLLCS